MVNVAAANGCHGGLLLGVAGPNAGCATAGGSGWVIGIVADRVAVAVTTTVWLNMSTRESVGVGVRVGKVTVTVRVGVTGNKVASMVGVSVAVGSKVSVRLIDFVAAAVAAVGTVGTSGGIVSTPTAPDEIGDGMVAGIEAAVRLSWGGWVPQLVSNKPTKKSSQRYIGGRVVLLGRAFADPN